MIGFLSSCGTAPQREIKALVEKPQDTQSPVKDEKPLILPIQEVSHMDEWLDWVVVIEKDGKRQTVNIRNKLTEIHKSTSWRCAAFETQIRSFKRPEGNRITFNRSLVCANDLTKVSSSTMVSCDDDTDECAATLIIEDKQDAFMIMMKPVVTER